MSRWTVLFSSVIPASGTRLTDKTFINGLLTIQDQELFKSHNKRKPRQQYPKSRFSGRYNGSFGCQFSPRLSRHIGCFREFPKSARIGNSFLVLLGCPFGRYDLGTTLRPAMFHNVNMKSDSTVHAQYYIPKPLTDLNAGVKCLGFLVMS